MNRDNRIKDYNGYTLVEMIIAFSLIVGALVGPVVLVLTGLTNSSLSKNKLIAANLAQEGIELVRLIREGNVLCDAVNGTADWDWRTDPSTVGATGSGSPFNVPTPTPTPKITGRVDVQDIVTYNDANCVTVGGAVSIEVPNFINDPNCLSNPTFLKWDSVNKIYTYQSGTETAFWRCIEICAADVSGACPNEDSTVNSQDQMSVISIVKWKERGQEKTIKLIDKLYNWR